MSFCFLRSLGSSFANRPGLAADEKGQSRRSFTEPALLAGLGVLLPMLNPLEETSIDELKKLVHQLLPDTMRKKSDASVKDV